MAKSKPLTRPDILAEIANLLIQYQMKRASATQSADKQTDAALAGENRPSAKKNQRSVNRSVTQC